MKNSKTQRGFSIFEFKDRYDAPCSLQKSSLATEDAIWLGTDFKTPLKCIQFQGWKEVQEGEPYSKEWAINSRMHLTREMVAELIPKLQYFVETGELK